MAEAKRGRVASDGVIIVSTQSARLTLDQVALDIVNEFTQKSGGNISAGIRAMAHFIHDSRIPRGHTQNTTTRAAAEPEIAGGHAENNTTRSGAGGAERRALNPRKRYERRAAGAGEPKMPVRVEVSHFKPDGTPYGLIQHMRMQEEENAKYEAALVAYNKARGM